jgi:hypothetical protein
MANISKTERAKRAKGRNPQINVKANTNVIEEKPLKMYTCVCCGKSWTKAQGRFSRSKSALFKGNDGYLPYCRQCLESYFDNMVDLYAGNDIKALERLCQLNDWFYDDVAIELASKHSPDTSLLSAYSSKMYLNQVTVLGITYADTIKNDYIKQNENKIESAEEIQAFAEKQNITEDIVRFWGVGFSVEEYRFLQNEYDDWIERHECSTKAQEQVFKSICFAQLNQLKAQKNGDSKAVAEATKTFQDLLGTANLKPSQNKDTSFIEQNTFGTLIQKWEEEKPIPEPLPEWQDVDGIVKYITVYFLGHLCKMMGIKNKYARAYEAEMSKYAVEMPEYEDDDDALFDAVFLKEEKEHENIDEILEDIKLNEGNEDVS